MDRPVKRYGVDTSVCRLSSLCQIRTDAGHRENPPASREQSSALCPSAGLEDDGTRAGRFSQTGNFIACSDFSWIAGRGDDHGDRGVRGEVKRLVIGKGTDCGSMKNSTKRSP
ncbi:hypothetical protein GALL_460510 [mine drainage metagenome]|uniref:Uncharacterized protein n=1 Tax=mine drainage metagenome TaxID=410659 RepID=A0A1J5PXN0_9ZZZZ